MKRLRKLFLLVAITIGVVFSAELVSIYTQKPTVCFTFDDGNLAHATVAAPLLEKYGWRGVFGIVTKPDMTDNPKWANLLRMSEAQAKELHERGHHVFPHTYSHPNMRKLAEAGNHDKVRYEVKQSYDDVIRITGHVPEFFVLPYNSMDDEVESVIVEHGMQPLSVHRIDFGGDSVDFDSGLKVSDFLVRAIVEHRPHLDLMIHGIIEEEGGYYPFKDADHFEAFLKVIGEFEKRGDIRVVDYCECHSGIAEFKRQIDEAVLYGIYRIRRKLHI